MIRMNKILQNAAAILEHSGDWNPQLLRELKGRLNLRNGAIAAAISLVGQLFLYFLYAGRLPSSIGSDGIPHLYNRYCTASPPPGSDYRYSSPYCIKDLLGHWLINWQLWWLDFFVALSIIGILALLGIGSYLLIADLSKEERRGTLNFIRLSPQPAQSIFLGKMIGVPILLYLVALLAFPLHLFAGLSASIPLSLILVFDGVLLASCAFFYSIALLYGLVSSGLGIFQPLLGSGILAGFLLLMTGLAMGGIATQTPLDWSLLFYPGTVLPYLVQATFLPSATVGYPSLESLTQLRWYGQSLWHNAWSGIGFVLCHYGLWTYWLGQALKRRFRNPTATLLSKRQSYWISGSLVVILTGFALQSSNSERLFDNFILLQACLMLFFLFLIAALSPHRQALQDWARYRHQGSRQERHLIKDLIWGEKSPSTLAIALNLGIVFTYLLPTILFFPLGEQKLPTLAGLWMSANIILIYAAITQLLLLHKSPKRFFFAAATVGALVILPIAYFGCFGINPSTSPLMWSFSFLPSLATQYATAATASLAILGQWLAIALLNFQIVRQLRKAGESQTKALLLKG
jgi:hypothetical protein